MKSLNILTLLFSANALAQNTHPPDIIPTIFPIPFPGLTQDIDSIQASAVSFATTSGVLALSCGAPDCPLKPSPTLTVDSTGAYRLNLGTVATQSCTSTSTDSRDYELTLVCTQSTSGVDTTSQTVTYSGSQIHYGNVTLTGGLDKYSSALSAIYATATFTLPASTPPSTTVPTVASTTIGPISTGSTSSNGVSTISGLTSHNSTSSNGPSSIGSGSTSTTSSAPSPSNAAGMISTNHGSTWIGAVAGVFACAFL